MFVYVFGVRYQMVHPTLRSSVCISCLLEVNFETQHLIMVTEKKKKEIERGKIRNRKERTLLNSNSAIKIYGRVSISFHSNIL